MRTISANLQTHLESTQQTLCFLWLVEPRRGAALGFTSLDSDVVYNPDAARFASALTFQSAGGIAPTEIPASIGLEPDSADATTLLDIGGVTRADLMTGRYSDANVTVYLVNYEDLTQSHVVLMAGKITKADISDNKVTFAFSTWSELLNRPLGRVTSNLCQWVYMRGFCRNNVDGFENVDATAPDDGPNPTQSGKTRNGTISAVLSKTRFTISGVTASDGWASFGRLRLVGGTYDGAEFEVKSWLSSGDLRLNVAMPFLPSVGQSVAVEEGCAHNWSACIAKGNTKNYGGQPWLPSEEVIAKTKDK